MSDKKMLNESAIRKMMKLANIPALSDKFIQENYYDYPPVTEQEDDVDVEVEDEVVLDAPADDVEVDAEVEAPAVDDLPPAEALVQDLMGVIEDHFEDVVINVDVEGEEEMPMDTPEPEMPMDEPEPELDVDVDLEEPAMDDEEEPVMETELEEGDTGVYGDPSEEGGAAMAQAISPGEQTMGGLEEEEETLEEEELEEMEDADAHSKLIDAIAAKVAERLLAEAKKTNE